VNILRLTTSHGGGDGQIWVNKIIFEVLGGVVMVPKYCIDWHSDGIVVHTSWVIKFPPMPWEVMGIFLGIVEPSVNNLTLDLLCFTTIAR